MTFELIFGKMYKNIFLKGKILMKIAKNLISLFVFILAVVCFGGCSHLDKTDVKTVISNELNLLKNLDSDTAQKYVSYKELFPDATTETSLSQEVEEVFSLFFQDFDYQILDLDVDEDKKEATAKIKLTTIDAQTLASDYAEASLKAAILKAASSDSADTEETTTSMEDRYLILDDLLKQNHYETMETECTIRLTDKGTSKQEWEIIRTHSLENDLVGGLMTYLSDSDLMSPEETLSVYLDTLKTMDSKQMGNYLGLESLLNTSDSAKNSIASALVDQVHKTLDYQITSCNIQSYNAVVTTEITTFDSASILSDYQSSRDTYLSSVDAVIDGSSKRYEHSLELLLNSIKENTDTVTSSVTFHLTNDGASWKLLENSEAIGNAIFGTLSTTPVPDETANFQMMKVTPNHLTKHCLILPNISMKKISIPATIFRMMTQMLIIMKMTLHPMTVPTKNKLSSFSRSKNSCQTFISQAGGSFCI